MAGRTTAVRAAAERRARDLRAHREALRKRQEAQIDAALADFFEASARADQIRSDAAEKAAAMIERAETDAAACSHDASHAIRTLRDLGQTNAEISEATGLSIRAVRTAAAGAGADGPDGLAAVHRSGGDSAPAGEETPGLPGATAGEVPASVDSSSNRSS